MSSNTPGPHEPTGPQPEVEYLDDQGPSRPRHQRRAGLVAAGAVAAVAAAGAGAWAVTQFMSTGPTPATVMPADTAAYLAVDLDPEGGQKIEAVQTLRKFPAIREELGLDGSEDLRRWLFEAVSSSSPCSEIDFSDDVDPWLGDKLGFGVRAGESEPVGFLVVQVKDQDLAIDALEKIAECADEDMPGTAFSDDYMLVAESDEIADGIVADAGEGSLADDEEFGRWIEEAGGSGIIEAYVSASAPESLGKTFLPGADDLVGGLAGPTSATSMSDSTGAYSSELEMTVDEPLPDVDEALEAFAGGALVMRFDDGALEVEMAAGGLPAELEAGGDSGLQDLPATTALALGFGVQDDAVERMLESFSEVGGLGEDEVDEMLAEAEADTGLELPEELQTLLGEGLSVAVDSSIDVGSLVEGSAPDPGALPVGVRIVGDTDEITGVLDKVEEAFGPLLGPLVVEEGDGVVALGINEDYVGTLAEDGALGDEERFQAALSDLDDSAGGFYLDFDAGDWLTELAATDPDSEELQENLEPLGSLGISGGADEDVLHAVVRLSTD
jgi:hypothetical protein